MAGIRLRTTMYKASALPTVLSLQPQLLELENSQKERQFLVFPKVTQFLMVKDMLYLPKWETETSCF